MTVTVEFVSAEEVAEARRHLRERENNMIQATDETDKPLGDHPSSEPLPEAKPKWICEECEEVAFEYLTAPNPFDDKDQITGCPHCRSVNSLRQACQSDGCLQEASGGYPGAYGYRYFHACFKHAPRRDKVIAKSTSKRDRG